MNIKNKINKITVYVLCCMFGLLAVSCDDFLDRPPYAKFDDKEFWQNETQARLFMYGIYTVMFPGYDASAIAPSTFYYADGNDDYMSGFNQSPLGASQVPETDGSWGFGNIRKANYIIENVDRIQDLNEAGINHWRGIGRFYRAFLYSGMVFRYGDVPWFDRVPVVSDRKEDMDYMYKPRDPRLYVVDRIMEDFDYAMTHVRLNDGALQINRYVVAAMASRLLLREGTFLKYHNIDQAKAEEVLRMAKKASELVMSGPYQISSDYRALFTSDDLAGNPEIIMYRKYEETGVSSAVTHNMIWTTTDWSVWGSSRSFAESFSTRDGLPVYYENEFWTAPTAAEFFANRDPRLSMILRPVYCIHGEDRYKGFVNYSSSGFSCGKYAVDDKFTGTGVYAQARGITDAPCLRLGEVLLNYAEIMYELGELTQGVLDNTINRLRSRKGVEMPRLVLAGNMPSVNGVVYDDPKRVQLNPKDDVSPVLWEIRRERRVELGHEGFRTTDLRRWKKYDYMVTSVNPDIRDGAYIRLADYPKRNTGTVVLKDPSATEGYIFSGRMGSGAAINRGTPTAKWYIYPVPKDQIILYDNKGYVLSQTKEWID